MSKDGRRKSDPRDSVGDIPEDLVRSWVTQHRDRMLRAARGYEGRAVTAEDIVQEAFRRAVLRFHTLRKHEAIGKWLVGITKRVGYQIARKRRWREPLMERNIREQEPAVVNPSRSEPDPQVGLVMEAAQSLPDAQRQVLHLSLLEGMTVGEIAEALGMPEGTVRVYRHRAVGTLKKLLGEDGGAG